MRVHGDVGAASVLVDEERPLPRLAAVGCAKHAALLLRSVGVAEGAREHDVGISRVDDKTTDAPGPIEAQVSPRFARVG